MRHFFVRSPITELDNPTEIGIISPLIFSRFGASALGQFKTESAAAKSRLIAGHPISILDGSNGSRRQK
jgi:hypothetical protein